MDLKHLHLVADSNIEHEEAAAYFYIFSEISNLQVLQVWELAPGERYFTVQIAVRQLQYGETRHIGRGQACRNAASQISIAIQLKSSEIQVNHSSATARSAKGR